MPQAINHDRLGLDAQCGSLKYRYACNVGQRLCSPEMINRYQEPDMELLFICYSQTFFAPKNFVEIIIITDSQSLAN